MVSESGWNSVTHTCQDYRHITSHITSISTKQQITVANSKMRRNTHVTIRWLNKVNNVIDTRTRRNEEILLLERSNSWAAEPSLISFIWNVSEKVKNWHVYFGEIQCGQPATGCCRQTDLLAITPRHISQIDSLQLVVVWSLTCCNTNDQHWANKLTLTYWLG